MSSIDERIVQMQFDNKQFESGVKETTSSLKQLKEGLNFDSAAKSLNSLEKSAGKFDISNIAQGVQAIQDRFSTMGIVAMNVISRITNGVLDLGTAMANALITQPLKDGFAEYETQLDSVQTILSNTQSKGTTIDQVNSALDELNTYADKTIYNFSQMTRNIGTFTAAGVDLQTSVDSIKGIANLAAASGSSATQASTAMYQLSQAIANGKVNLQDWNSVVNAGMGGELFQNALKRTAEHMGTDVDSLISKYGSFRESLTKGEWLTTDVLTETLKQISGAYTEADLIAQGYTEDQAAAIAQLADTAEEAATKVKTFSQLIDTLKEALGSGWTKSWEYIFGDYEEAKVGWTNINDLLSGMINDSANARNSKLLEGFGSGYKQLVEQGITDTTRFKEVLSETAKSAGVDIDSMTADGTALQDTFTKGWVTGDMLKTTVQTMTDELNNMSQEERDANGYTSEYVENMQKLNEELQNGTLNADEFASKMGRASGRENMLEGIYSIMKTLQSVIGAVKEGFEEIIPPITGEQIYQLTVKFKDFITSLEPTTETLENLKTVGKGFASVLDLILQAIKAVASPFADFLTGGAMDSAVGTVGDLVLKFANFAISLDEAAKSGTFFSEVSSAIKSALEFIGSKLQDVNSKIDGFIDNLNFSSVLSGLKSFLGIVGDGLSSAIGWLGENGVPIIKTTLKVLAALWTAQGAKDFLSTMSNIKEKVEGLIGKAKDAKEAVGDGKGGGILGNLLGIDFSEAADSFNEVLGSLHDSLDAFTTGLKIGSIVLVAAAIATLVGSIKVLSEINGASVTASIVAIGVLFKELNTATKSLVKNLQGMNTKDVLKVATAMLVMAKAVQWLSDAVVTLSDLGWEELGKGLTGVAGGLGGLVAAVKIIGDSGIKLSTSVAILALAESCKILAEAMKTFSGFSWDEIARGLTAMGGALAEIVAAVKVLGKVSSGGKALAGAISVVAIALVLGKIADAFQDFASMDWESIGRGAVAMGAALGEVVAAVAILGKFAGFKSILGSVSIAIVVNTLDELYSGFKDFGSMDWDSIGRAAVGMGVALGEVAASAGILGTVAGLSGIFGAGSIKIVTDGLGQLADAFQKFGSMSWDQVGVGLTGMGLALLEVAGLSGALGMIAGFSGILGAGSILIAVQSLQPIADALQQIGSMTWDQIATGLEGMGLAMLVIGGMATALGAVGGMAAVGALALDFISLSLMPIYEALKQFASLSWDEINTGITAMTLCLAALATGGFANSLGIIGDLGIAIVAEPLGTLADSMKKWATVKVPSDLGDQLTSLGKGLYSFFNEEGIFGMLSSGSLPDTATGLGELATAMGKWKNVTIPEGLDEQLGNLGSAVDSFVTNLGLFGSLGVGSLGDSGEALGKLATGVSKWKDVTVPSDLGTSLTSLSDGIKGFTTAGLGAATIMAFAEPIGSFATNASKWANFSLPSTIGTDLSNLGTGIGSISSIANPYALNTIGNGLTTIYNASSAMQGVDYASVGSALVTFSTDMATVNSNLSGVSESIAAMFTSIASTVTSSVSSLTSSLSSKAKEIPTAISSGVSSNSSTATNALRSLLQSCSSIASSFSSNGFRTAGYNMAIGLANGIRAGRSSVISAATSVATAALTAAKSALGEHSPSRYTHKFGLNVDYGLINGMLKLKKRVASSAASVGTAAIDGISGSMNSIQNGSFSKLTPVLDYSKTTSIGSLPSTRSMAISAQLTNASVINPISSMKQSMEYDNARVLKSNTDVLNAVTNLNDNMANYADAVANSETAMYVDGKKLASTIARPMNSSLGQLQRRSKL